MSDILVAGGGDVSGARANYVSYSNLNSNEGTRRLLFSDSEDNLTAKNSYNVLSGGQGRPADGDVLELIISTKEELFKRLGETTEESKESFKDSIRSGLGKLFADLKIDNVRYVAGIHLNTPNPHAHVLIYKGVQNAETGEPLILEKIPRQWFYKSQFESSKIGQYFDDEIAKRTITAPPELTHTIPADNVFLPAPELDDSTRSIKAFTSFAERNNVSLKWLERLRQESSLYVNRQGGITFVKRNSNFEAVGYTNDNGWDGKDTEGLFFIGNPQKATKFALVQSPKDAIALLELVGSRDLSETCFISCDGNVVPPAAVELLKNQSLNRSTKIIWSFNLDRKGGQEDRDYAGFQEAVLAVHSPESPSLEFHTYAPRLQYGKTWKDQLFIRNVPGELAAMMKRQFVYKKSASVDDELIDVQSSNFIKDVFERVEIVEAESSEFIVYQKQYASQTDAKKIEYGRYKWSLTDQGSVFEITSVGGEPVNAEITEILAADESEIIGTVEDAFIVQTELKYIQEIERQSETIRLENNSENLLEATLEKSASLPIIKSENNTADRHAVGKISSAETLRQIAYDKAKAVTENLNKISVEAVLSMLGFSKVNRGETVYEDAAGQFRIFVTDVEGGQLWNDRKDGMRGNKGGLNLVRHILNYDFKQAKEWMVSYFGADYVPTPTEIKNREEKVSEPKKLLRMPVRNDRNLPIVIDYLVNERAVSLDFVNELIGRDLLYANSWESAVFVHTDPNGQTTGASWRATVGNKRQDVTGSDKNRGWFHLGNLQEATRFVITEAPIEAISYLELHPELDLQTTVIIAAAGNNLTKGLYKQINQRGADGEIILAFNGDTGGEAGVLNVKEKLGLLVQLRHKKSYLSNGIDEDPYQGNLTVELPATGDWNDQLKELRFEAREINQAEHVNDEINLINESIEFAKNADVENQIETSEEIVSSVLESFENQAVIEAASDAATAIPASDGEAEAIHLSGDEIEEMVENFVPDFDEKKLRVVNIHLPGELKKLGKLEMLFARDPDLSENFNFTGYRITFNGDIGYAGYTLEKLPTKAEKPARIGKLGLQQGVMEIHGALNEKWREITAAEQSRKVIFWNEKKFIANALNEVEIYGRKVTGLYNLPPTFAVKAHFSEQEKSVIREWQEFTKPGEFYTPEEIFVKTYSRNVAKRAALTDLLNRGYLQLKITGDDYPKIKGGNPLVAATLNAFAPELVETKELVIEREPEMQETGSDAYHSNISETIAAELKRLNSDFTFEIADDSETDVPAYVVSDENGEEIFRITSPTAESDGWIIAQPTGKYDEETDEYVEIATVEYAFELGDALGDLLGIPVNDPVAETSAMEDIKVASIVYRALGADNVRRHYEQDKDHYLTELKGTVEGFTKNFSRDGKNLYLGIKFKAENGLIYQQKFGDTSFDKNDTAIFRAIKEGQIRKGDEIFFSGYVNEHIETLRRGGKGFSAVPVFASRYEHTSSAKIGDPVLPESTNDPIELTKIAEDIKAADAPDENVNERRNPVEDQTDGYNKLKEFIKFTDRKFPELGISIGYTGSETPDDDDRQYSVFTKIKADSFDETPISYGSFNSWDTLAVAVFEKKEFDEFINVVAGARYTQENLAVSQTLDRLYDERESITEDFLRSETRDLVDSPAAVPEQVKTSVESEIEMSADEDHHRQFDQLSPVGDLEFNLGRGIATLEYFTEKGYAITSTPSAFQVWDGGGYAQEPEFTDIREAVVLVGDSRGKFINVRGAYNLRVIPQEHHTFAVYDLAVKNIGEFLQTYAETLAANEVNDFVPPTISKPLLEEKAAMKLEWKPRPVKSEDFYNYGNKKSQARAIETQTRLARNSADFLNVLDAEFAGKLTAETREKLNEIISAIHSGCYDLGIGTALIDEVEIAKRFSRQVKTDGSVIESAEPEKVENSLEKELRIFNELLQENEITANHVVEFDEEESEVNETLTLAVREKNTSLPTYIITPPDWNEIYYALTELEEIPATRDEPGDVSYREIGLYKDPREVTGQIVKEFQRLHQENQSEAAIDEDYPLMADRDSEFEAIVRDVQRDNENTAETSETPEIGDSENSFETLPLSTTEPTATELQKPAAPIYPKSVIEKKSVTETVAENVAPIARLLSFENAPELAPTSEKTLSYSEEVIDKVFQVTATDADQEHGKNYRWTEAALHHAGNKKRFQWNMEAITLLRQLTEERRYPETEIEKTTLAKFSGWGSMKGVFNAYTDDSKTWEKERQQAASMLTGDEFAAASTATLNSHFTDGKIVDVAWRVADRLGFTGGRVIEPSVGNGIFIGRVPEFLKSRTQFTGIEKDTLTAKIAEKLFPESKIREGGYEDHIVPNGWYDLAIGNVPFGDYKVFDKVYNHLNANIHDYFSLKSLDQVRDGGLQVLITSSFTLDKSNDKIRDRISKEGVLVGALRFPNTTFQKNAGTEVVTDLLLIRKKTAAERQTDILNSESYEIAKTKYKLLIKDIEKTEAAYKKTRSKTREIELKYKLHGLREELKPIEINFIKETALYEASRPDWMKIVSIPDPDGGERISINKYFAENPEMVLGTVRRSGSMYHSDSVTVEGTDDFDDRLEKAFALLPEKVAKPRTEMLDENLLDRIIVDETIKNGTIRVDGGKVLRAEAQIYGGIIFKEDMEVTPAETRRIERLLAIRDASRTVINADLQKDTHQSVNELRKELNYLYDSFVRDFGALHLKKNQDLLKGDSDLPRLLAIEEFDAKSKESAKTAIFEKPTVRHFEQPQQAAHLTDALGITLNEFGRLYLPRVMFLLNKEGEAIEQTYLRVQKEFVSSGIAFLDPKNDEWTMREEYLAGNVRDRLQLARLAAESEPERYRKNVEELEKIIPVDLDYTEIDVELGASWLEKEDVADFLAYLTGGSRTDFVVAHAERSGFWAVEYSSAGYSHRYKPTTTEIWGTGRCNMIEAVQYLSDGRSIVIKDTDTDDHGNTIYVTNLEETEAANQKAAEIQDEFKDWVWQDEPRRLRLARKYNDLFNSFLPVKYDGSHLTFPGMATEINGKPFELRRNQKDAIWRGIREGKALFGHEVGTGKTYLEIALAMKMKQVGLTNKPLLGYLKKNIRQAVGDARDLYPHANILSTDGSFDSKKRKETVSKIATGNYDLVFMTHDHIDMLPMRPESRARHINEQLAELDEVMAVAKHLNKSFDGKSKAETRLHSRLEKAKENLEVRLKEVLGKSKDDAIYFEETGIDLAMIDEFHYYKSLQIFTVKTGIKGIPTNFSERAINMYARFSWLQEKNNGRNTYGATGTPLTNTMAELYNQQKYFQRETLEERGIIAFDSWMHNFARTISKMEKTATGEYKTVERLCEFTNLPELVAMSGQFLDIYLAAEMPELNRPPLEIEIVKSKMTDDQRAFIKTLQLRAQDLKYGDSDNMLAISTDARKVSLDPRLVIRNAEDDPEYKVNKLVNIALDNLKLPGIRTQMIFAELGIHDVVFEDIVKKLIAGGVPKEKIINFSTMTASESVTAVPRLRSGDALFGLGSTKTLGTGVNAQDNLYAIFNLDTHWLPAYDKQRRGRIERSGNRFYYENEKVKSYYFLTEGGFDEIMYAANDRKQTFIDSVMFAKGDPAKVLHRKVRDADTEEITYAEIAAVASGNPLILVQLELDKEVRSLSNQERRHQTSQIRLKGELTKLNRHVEEYDRDGIKYTLDHELWQRETNRIETKNEANIQANIAAKEEYNDWLDLKKIEVHEGKLTKVELEALKEPKRRILDDSQLPENNFEVELAGVVYNNRTAAGEKLGTLVNDRIFHDTVIGVYKGMKIVAQVEYRSEVRTIGLALQSPSNVKYSVNYWTDEGAFKSMEHLSQKLPEFIQYQNDNKASTEVNLEKIQTEIGKPFKFAARLKEAKRELADVEFEISIFNLSDEEKNLKLAEREAKRREIKVTMPEHFVTAEESGFFDTAKKAVDEAVTVFRNGLPEGSLAKPAMTDINPGYYREAARLREEPLSAIWYKMSYENIGRGQMKVNPAAYALIQKAYSQMDGGKTLEFAGLYNEPEKVRELTRVLRDQSKTHVNYKSVLNKFADSIDAAGAERAGTVSFIAENTAIKHEAFHADSYVAAAGKTLEARHTRLDQLVEHEAFQIAQKNLKKEYRNDNCAMHVEELANDISEALDQATDSPELNEGEKTPHNLSREQMESYLDLWFTSFAEANGLVSREKFEELNENAKEIRDVAYNRIADPNRQTESDEFKSVEPTLGGISSEEKRRAFYEKLCRAELKRKITDDLIQRQTETSEVVPKFVAETLGDQIGEAVSLDEQIKNVDSKITALSDNRYEKEMTVEHQGETVTTSFAKLREERIAAAENALKIHIDSGFLKVEMADGKKSQKMLERDFLGKKQVEAERLQKPLFEKLNKAFYGELNPLERESETLRERMNRTRDAIDEGIARKEKTGEEIPMPVINPDNLWLMQENAIKRGDLDSFERLERIHQLSELPRAPRAAGRLAALAVVSEVAAGTEKRDFKLWAEDASETTRVRLTITNENETLVTRNWDAARVREEQTRLEEKGDKTRTRAQETRKQSYQRLLDPIKNKINPLSNVQGSVSWLTDPKGTFNAHFNPIEVIKNDPAVQICRAAFNFFKKQGEAKMIEARAAEILRGIEPLNKEIGEALDGEVKRQFTLRQAKMENAEQLKEAVSNSIEREKAVRSRLIENGEVDGESLGEPKEIFLKDELREVGQASIELGDAKLLKLYERAVEKPMIADVLGEGTPRVAARVVMAHAETAAIAREAVENVVKLEDGTTGAIELSPTKLLDVQKHLEASDVAEAWLKRLDPENLVEPMFTPPELVRLDELKYSMDLNSVNAVDTIVSANKITQTASWTENALLNADHLTAVIPAPTQASATISEMVNVMNTGGNLSSVITDEASKVLAQNVQLYATGTAEINMAADTPKYKITEPLANADESKQFWQKLRQAQDERIGVQKIETQIFEQEQIAQTIAAEAVAGTEAGEGAAIIVAVL